MEWSGVASRLVQSAPPDSGLCFSPCTPSQTVLGDESEGGGGAGHEEWEKAALEGRAVSE